MTNPLTQALAQIGEQVDHLNVPDLRTLALALQAERERIRAETAEVLQQMQAERAQAIGNFTQLMLCARPDFVLHEPGYFDSIQHLRELRHE